MTSTTPRAASRPQDAVRVEVSDEGAAPTPEDLRAMVKPSHLRGASGFFDPADPDHEAQVVLERLVKDGQEQFTLLRRIGYWHNEIGPIVVPRSLAEFRTDLTSVPAWFTWLIPKSGLHLPAALIHDGLVLARDEPQTYVARAEVPRAMADQIFRDGMRDLDTTLVRRWLMWTAVTLATLWCCTHKWWFRVVMPAEVLLISVLGAAATIDLFSDKALLPWMGHRPMWVEVITGSLFAALVPCLLSVLWGRWWRAGVITGLALALLFHVTIAIAVVSSLFQAVENVFQRRALPALGWLGAGLGSLAGIVLLAVWAAG